MDLNTRDQAILCGLYLSQHDEEGLDLMGFKSFKEAYNVLGFSLGVKPASIKNYRDEFDPIFPNSRKGWHKRSIRPSCQNIYDRFQHYKINDFVAIIARITGCAADTVGQTQEKESGSFAKRLLTGRAAENYFSQNYRKENEFSGSTVEDVTQTGCGYDFRLHWPDSMQCFAIEVKGLAAVSGSIMFTDKEYNVANELTNDYFVYVVKNFDEEPFAKVIRNPTNENSCLAFRKQERKIVQISWSTNI